MVIQTSVSNVLCTASSCTVQSVHLVAGPVIKSFTASSGAEVSSGHKCLPEVKANAKDLRLKTKAKDIPCCSRGTSSPRTWPQGLQHC